MATTHPSTEAQPIILSAKPQVQIETSTGGTLSTTTKTATRKSPPKSVPGKGKETILLIKPMPKYSFQATKKKSEPDLQKPLAAISTSASSTVPEQALHSSQSAPTFKNVNYTANPVPINMPINMNVPSFTNQMLNSSPMAPVSGQPLLKQKPVSKVDPFQFKTDFSTVTTSTVSMSASPFVPINLSLTKEQLTMSNQQQTQSGQSLYSGINQPLNSCINKPSILSREPVQIQNFSTFGSSVQQHGIQPFSSGESVEAKHISPSSGFSGPGSAVPRDTLLSSFKDPMQTMNVSASSSLSGPGTTGQEQVTSLSSESVQCPASSSASETSAQQNSEIENRYKEEAERLKIEVNNLRRQLDVQFQVNGELKKLLVASVGDDLQFRVENLARDRAQLSSELGHFAKKSSEDFEHLDKISIQADMWRSKFLASRVMVDELASAKAFITMQCQESQSALQEMLTERHELRTNLMKTYNTLQQVKSAFDPLNTQNSMGIPSTNGLDLARVNQRLAENIRYRLLPSHVALDTVVNLDTWIDNLTLAESRAHELLSKRINFDDVRQHIPSSLCDPGTNVIDRFHPYTRFDNLTLNCCVKCQGEMFGV